MKISRTSYVSKFIEDAIFAPVGTPHTTCEYIRKFFSTFALSLVIGCLAALFLFLVITPFITLGLSIATFGKVGYGVHMWFYIVWSPYTLSFIDFFNVFGCMVVSASVVTGCIILIVKKLKARRSRKAHEASIRLANKINRKYAILGNTNLSPQEKSALIRGLEIECAPEEPLVGKTSKLFGIFAQFIKDSFHKMCTRIEWVD